MLQSGHDFLNKAEWPWRYKSRSKVIVYDTPSHGSDHLWLIWKESILNCRCYRADTAAGTDGQTDRRTEWNQYTPQQLCCSGGIIIFYRQRLNLHSWMLQCDLCISKITFLGMADLELWRLGNFGQHFFNYFILVLKYLLVKSHCGLVRCCLPTKVWVNISSGKLS